MTRDHRNLMDEARHRVQELLGNNLSKDHIYDRRLSMDELPQLFGEGRPARSNTHYKQYPLNKYAWQIYKAIKSFNFPAITCNFRDGRKICHCKCTRETNIHRECMRKVEKKIRNQLLSGNAQVVKDGLANVLYWGYTEDKLKQTIHLNAFRKNKNFDKELLEFRKFCIDHHSNPSMLSEPVLRHITKLPQFGISFASKTMMFLDPDNYPVLDSRIANFAKLSCFPPLQNLSMNASGDVITPGQANEKVYEKWASWCRDTAKAVRIYSRCPPPIKDLRAVDVERAIYQLVGSKKDPLTIAQRQKNHLKAQRLLLGPGDPDIP